MSSAASFPSVEPDPFAARRCTAGKALSPGLRPALALTLTQVEPKAGAFHHRPTVVVEAPTLRAEAVAARVRRLLS